MKNVFFIKHHIWSARTTTIPLLLSVQRLDNDSIKCPGNCFRVRDSGSCKQMIWWWWSWHWRCTEKESGWEFGGNTVLLFLLYWDLAADAVYPVLDNLWLPDKNAKRHELAAAVVVVVVMVLHLPQESANKTLFVPLPHSLTHKEF